MERRGGEEAKFKKMFRSRKQKRINLCACEKLQDAQIPLTRARRRAPARRRGSDEAMRRGGEEAGEDARMRRGGEARRQGLQTLRLANLVSVVNFQHCKS